MGKWFDKIINKLWGVDITTERADYETSNIERKVRDLRRRIEEHRKWIGYYTPRSGTSSEFTKVEEPIQDMGKIQKNAELDALKAKLTGKK